MKKIVLTGGPCAGKTTAKSFLYEKLSKQGFSVILVPEVATMMIEAGLHPAKLATKQMLVFQELILKTQLTLENRIFSQALDVKNGQKQVLIMDRGCMDGAAYVAKTEFQKVLKNCHLNIVKLRERYDAVFHLITAAEGAEKFYNHENHARYETAEQARQLDRRIREVWLGHSHLSVIDNDSGFKNKLKRLLKKVYKALGIPAPIETERKFLLPKPRLSLFKLLPHQTISIEQAYILKNGQKQRLRRRSQSGEGAAYYRTQKSPTNSPMSRTEIENRISAAEYYADLAHRRSGHDILRKKRVYFLWKNQYFELDIFTSPTRLRGLVLLEIELTTESDSVDLPHWLGKMEEVTENPNFHNSKLAKNGIVF